jgi:ribosomal protein L7/L12
MDDLELRIADLERRVALLEGGVRAAPVSHDEVALLARQGNMIGAIKLYRQQTGVGLREAKDAVEALARGF